MSSPASTIGIYDSWIGRAWSATVAVTLALSSIVLFAPEDLFWHDQQRLFQLLLLLLSLGFVSRFGASPQLLTGPSSRGIAGVFILGGLSAATGAAPAWAWLEWSWFAANTALLLSIAMASTHNPDGAKTFAGWVLGAFSSLYSLKILAGLTAVYWGHWKLDTSILIDGFSNRRFFGQYATLIWPILTALAAETGRSKRWRWGMSAAASLLIFVILISQTRGTLYGLIVGILLLTLLRRGGLWWRTAFVSIAAGTGLYLALIWAPGWLGLTQLSDVELHFDDAGLSGREILWHNAIVAIQQHPWLGLGPMGFAALHDINGAHPHSSLLQIAVEWGVPAGLISGGLILSGLWNLVAAVRSDDSDAWGSGLLVALAASLTQSLVDGVFVMPLSQTGLMCCAGLAVAWVTRNSSGADNVARRPSPALRLVLLAVAATLLTSFAITLQAPGNGLLQRQLCQEWNTVDGKPRFWECGWTASPH